MRVSAVAAHQLSLWSIGSVALQQVGSSQTKDQTCIPCFGRQILNRWTTREVDDFTSLNLSFPIYNMDIVIVSTSLEF